MTWLVVNARLRIPKDEFEFRFDRSSGPGGQNVNKVNTKVTLRWRITTSASLPEFVRERLIQQNRRRITTSGDLLITSQRFRDQRRNIDDCLGKLRNMLDEATVVRKQRKPTKATKGSRERRLKEKRARSESKQRRKSPRMDD